MFVLCFVIWWDKITCRKTLPRKDEIVHFKYLFQKGRKRIHKLLPVFQAFFVSACETRRIAACVCSLFPAIWYAWHDVPIGGTSCNMLRHKKKAFKSLSWSAPSSKCPNLLYIDIFDSDFLSFAAPCDFQFAIVSEYCLLNIEYWSLLSGHC